ncbi:hypothetical protein [Streptomyces sp. YIM 98790]|uniref:DUF7848 domain-containing protein n=1 Tax=Streptomyces sp. YIM 98790 TaxID=2689077 RepID=UPI0014094A2E|nr:hypothetical protein [Streptomyces sp. YIM 98790]
MTTRTVMRYVNWTLTADTDAEPPSHTAECTTCAETSPPSPSRDAPELWCLRHAGRTRHPTYRYTITGHLRATPAE